VGKTARGEEDKRVKESLDALEWVLVGKDKVRLKKTKGGLTPPFTTI
jgi:hypothetical protein